MTYTAVTEISPWRRLRTLEERIIEAVPPIEPSQCHWLNSDSCESYCHAHAWEARWRELPTFGPCPPIPEWFNRSGLEEIMLTGLMDAQAWGV